MNFFNIIVIFSVLITSFSSAAEPVDKLCNVNLSAGFTMNESTLEFIQDTNEKITENKSLYKIIEGVNLFINNQRITLTDTQKELVNKYDKNIRQLVPQVKKVAIEGVDSAIEGVNVAFNGLLGEGNRIAEGLTKELMLVRTQVESNLSIEKGISVGTEGLEGEALLGKNFKQRIKSSVETTVLNSMGSILMSLGQQMISTKGSSLSFEERINKFSQSIEREIAVRTATI